MDYDKIIAFLLAFIEEDGGEPGDYYVGIAEDDEQRLFQDHGVDRTSNSWRSCLAKNHETARYAEIFFTEGKGTKGGPGGGSNRSLHVYIYRITSRTRQ